MSMGTGVLMPWGRKADNLSPSSAELMKEWSYTSTPLHAFLTCTGTSNGSERGYECLDWSQLAQDRNQS
jgi:hypothetical protein